MMQQQQEYQDSFRCVKIMYAFPMGRSCHIRTNVAFFIITPKNSMKKHKIIIFAIVSSGTEFSIIFLTDSWQTITLKGARRPFALSPGA